MATSPNTDSISEPCPACDAETPHEISVQILTESTKTENAEFSREPYRVSVCRACGHKERVRMNNA
jgi:hypothetical protein